MVIMKKAKSIIFKVYNLVFWPASGMFIWWLMTNDSITTKQFCGYMILFFVFSLPKQMQVGIYGEKKPKKKYRALVSHGDSIKKRELLKALESVSPDADIIIGFTMSKEELEKYPGQSIDAEGHVVYTVERHIGEVEADINKVYIDLGEDFHYEAEKRETL